MTRTDTARLRAQAAMHSQLGQPAKEALLLEAAAEIEYLREAVLTASHPAPSTEPDCVESGHWTDSSSPVCQFCGVLA